MPRLVIVTGGSRGLGLAISAALAGAGFAVLAVARQEGAALAGLRAAQPGIAFEPADLADIDGLAGLVRAWRTRHGPVYGLVNNAGIGTAGVLATMPDRAIESLVRLNVTSPITLTKYVVRGMMARGEGRVVSLSSVVAANGYSGLSAYSATKAALVGFTKSLAREIGPLGITVNAVAPGFVQTDMTHGLDGPALAQLTRRSALRRLPDAADVAAAVLFLMGEQARNITGTIVTVDAGNTA